MNSNPLVTPVPGSFRFLAASGGVLAAVSVALLAYAAHTADPSARTSLHSAALFAFGHGIALAALAPRVGRRLALAALGGLLLGTLLFSGSIVGSHVFGTPTSLAPLGGGLMILSWLMWAVDATRR